MVIVKAVSKLFNGGENEAVNKRNFREVRSSMLMCSKIFFTMALLAHSGPRPLIQFNNNFSQTVGLLGWVISPAQGRYLNTGEHKHRINAYIHQTFMR
jgi:hypothetical protein